MYFFYTLSSFPRRLCQHAFTYTLRFADALHDPVFSYTSFVTRPSCTHKNTNCRNGAQYPFIALFAYPHNTRTASSATPGYRRLCFFWIMTADIAMVASQPVAGVPVDNPALLVAESNISAYVFKDRFARLLFANVQFTQTEAQVCFYRFLWYVSHGDDLYESDYYLFRHIFTRGLNVERDANRLDLWLIGDIAKQMCQKHLRRAHGQVSDADLVRGPDTRGDESNDDSESLGSNDTSEADGDDDAIAMD